MVNYINDNSPSNITLYHNSVIKLLDDNKEKALNDSMLLELQIQIENLTMNFEEKSVFKSSPSLLKLLISDNMITAKEYLKQKKCGLSEDELASINKLGTYTLEALIIHVLGCVFNCLDDLSVVRVATLVDQIDSSVRVHMGIINAEVKYSFLQDKKSKKSKKRKLAKGHYAIGTNLVQFLIDRKLIDVITEENFKGKLPVSTKKGKGYTPSSCYAVCKFDLKILPVKLNLPMVYKPLPWGVTKEKEEDVDLTLADIKGGYLSGLTGEIYNRFRLLTSRNYNNFYIKLKEKDELFKVLNTLQSQEFEINNKVLCFIKENRDTLEDVGLLMNRSLSKVNLQEASDLLRFSYVNDNKGVKEVCSCNFLLEELVKRVQRARYEDFVLTLADAYSAYKFYLPAFMDFRGRIYRAGVLHFHERDLAKSLIFFSPGALEAEPNESEEGKQRWQLACAAAFKYKKFSSLDKSYEWYMGTIADDISDKSIINLAQQASDPFQFIAKVLSNERVIDHKDRMKGLKKVPVTQDASASAYQIMSYLLLNEEMGMRTNLLPSPDGKIQDLYLYLKDELNVFLQERLEKNKYAIIESKLTRNLVKLLFMPLIYGKTVRAMASDIRDVYDSLLSYKDYYHTAQLCYEFLVNKYPGIANLMKLINLIGGICSALGKPVNYCIPYFTTVQDYMRSDTACIWVYDRVTKKKRQVNLRVPTLERDKRKTQVSTCVNFIHQRDAFIAMKVVEQLTYNSNKKAPVYTVHDNFITTTAYAAGVPKTYTNVFMEMGHPLRIIDEFIYINLIPRDLYNELFNHRKLYSEYMNKPYPILNDDLIRDFKSLGPKDMSNKDKLKWYKKIDDTVSCYTEYVITVCGYAPNGEMYNVDKWNYFHSQLKRWDSLKYNYSLHY